MGVMTVRCVHLMIEGRVQGVWFRAWTVKTADHFGLNGWVRNRTDGSVEVIAAGSAGCIDAFISACHEGPPLAEVLSVTVRECSAANLPEPLPTQGFIQKPTT